MLDRNGGLSPNKGALLEKGKTNYSAGLENPELTQIINRVNSFDKSS